MDRSEIIEQGANMKDYKVKRMVQRFKNNKIGQYS